MLILSRHTILDKLFLANQIVYPDGSVWRLLGDHKKGGDHEKLRALGSEALSIAGLKGWLRCMQEALGNVGFSRTAGWLLLFEHPAKRPSTIGDLSLSGCMQKRTPCFCCKTLSGKWPGSMKRFR